MKLNELRDNPGARLKSKRLGRGIGSGKGKTSGKGVKGQKARDRRGAERLRGRPDADLPPPAEARLQESVPQGICAGEPRRAGGGDRAGQARRRRSRSPRTTLRAAGLVRGGKLHGVRLLAKGEITRAVTITVSGASAAAIEAVEKAGGTRDHDGRAEAGGGRADVCRPERGSQRFVRSADRCQALMRRLALDRARADNRLATDEGRSWPPLPNSLRQTSTSASSPRRPSSRSASGSPSAR